MTDKKPDTTDHARDDQQTLGQLRAARKALSAEVLRTDYFKLRQTRDNKMQADANDIILKDGTFLRACELAGIQPTRRQASKWSRKVGKAYTRRNG